MHRLESWSLIGQLRSPSQQQVSSACSGNAAQTITGSACNSSSMKTGMMARRLDMVEVAVQAPKHENRSSELMVSSLLLLVRGNRSIGYSRSSSTSDANAARVMPTRIAAGSAKIDRLALEAVASIDRVVLDGLSHSCTSRMS